MPTPKGKKITMRFGDIEFCEPLGLASYGTVGEVRNLVIKKLPPAEKDSNQ